METKLTAVYDSQTGQAKPVREEELRAGEGVPLASWNVLIDKIDELRIQNDELLRECNYLRDRLTEEEDGNLALHERARLAESRLKKIYELASDFSAS